MHQILKSHSGALGTVCSALMSWGEHSWGPLTDSRAHAQMQLPSQRGQVENHYLGEDAALQLTNILKLSLPPTCKTLPHDARGSPTPRQSRLCL